MTIGQTGYPRPRARDSFLYPQEVFVNGKPLPQGMEASVTRDVLKGAAHWASRFKAADGFMALYESVPGIEETYRLRTPEGNYEAQESDVVGLLREVFPGRQDFVDTQMQRLRSFGAIVVNRKTGEVFTR